MYIHINYADNQLEFECPNCGELKRYWWVAIENGDEITCPNCNKSYSILIAENEDLVTKKEPLSYPSINIRIVDWDDKTVVIEVKVGSSERWVQMVLLQPEYEKKVMEKYPTWKS